MNKMETIRKTTQLITDLLFRIDEYKSYINQLSNGTMARLGSAESNAKAIAEYKITIAYLENEINQIWNNR